MLDQLENIQQEAFAALQSLDHDSDLQRWKVTYLGRSSALMQVFDGMGKLSKDQRPAIGKRANEVKRFLEAAFAEKEAIIQRAALERSMQQERLDVTLAGRPVKRGRLHITSLVLRQIRQIFAEMGFQVFRSREIETDELNFQLLNFPPNHPARELQDSLYINSGADRGDNPILLRTHTSPGQIRSMRVYAMLNSDNPPPIRIILPGMCFRFEQVTTRHEMQFNQVEGLAVGPNITFGDLKGTLSDFARRMFGQNVRTRFRASHFPFTEPSAEMDIECFVCQGQGCSVCKRSGWLEILGCGMVHPVVLQNGGYDPQKYSGFAFGMGPERIAMLRYRIEDIRYFWANDIRFLEQF